MADGEQGEGAQRTLPHVDLRVRHGGKLTHLTWCHIQKRCYKKHHKTYPDYGGKGIRVFFGWLGPGGFAQFVKDVGLRPSRAHQLDRIDPDKHYEPGNVRWLPRKVNLSQVRRVDHRGDTVTARGPDGRERTETLRDWADRLGLKYRSLSRRLQRARTPEARWLVFTQRRKR